MSEEEREIFYDNGGGPQLGPWDQLREHWLEYHEIDGLGLEKRTRNALARSGLYTRADIEFFISRGLLGRVRNIGRGREQEIKQRLQQQESLAVSRSPRSDRRRLPRPNTPHPRFSRHQ